MKYFANYDENGRLLAIGTGNGGTEITEDEYHRLLEIIRKKAELVDSLYCKEITIDDVPAEWQDEIQRRVNERIEQDGAFENEELTDEEVLEILLGGAV